MGKIIDNRLAEFFPVHTKLTYNTAVWESIVDSTGIQMLFDGNKCPSMVRGIHGEGSSVRSVDIVII